MAYEVSKGEHSFVFSPGLHMTDFREDEGTDVTNKVQNIKN